MALQNLILPRLLKARGACGHLRFRSLRFLRLLLPSLFQALQGCGPERCSMPWWTTPDGMRRGLEMPSPTGSFFLAAADRP